jgi:hypothetical protein
MSESGVRSSQLSERRFRSVRRGGPPVRTLKLTVSRRAEAVYAATNLGLL